MLWNKQLIVFYSEFRYSIDWSSSRIHWLYLIFNVFIVHNSTFLFIKLWISLIVPTISTIMLASYPRFEEHKKNKESQNFYCSALFVILHSSLWTFTSLSSLVSSTSVSHRYNTGSVESMRRSMLPDLTDKPLQSLFFQPQELQSQISPRVQTLHQALAQAHTQVPARYSYIGRYFPGMDNTRIPYGNTAQILQ